MTEVALEQGETRLNINDDKVTGSCIRKTVHNYTQNSSVHGIKYVDSFTVAKFRKLVWCFIIITSVGFCACMIRPRVIVYLRKPVNTKITIEFKSPLTFPAVTICNLNMLRRSYLEKDPAFKPFLKQPLSSITKDNATLEALKNYTMMDLVSNGGHQLEEMFLSCNWRDDNIKCKDYMDPILTEFGKCYTFNSNKYKERNGGKALQSDASGIDHGLYLRINITQDEYTFLGGQSAGIKVLIHDQQTFPIIKEFGFAVAPGTETFAAFRSLKMSYLPAPYEGGTCIDIADAAFATDLEYFKHYSQSACRKECESKLIATTCNCSFLITDNRYRLCTFYDYTTCIATSMKEIAPMTGELCICQTPCEITDYTVQVSSALSPSSNMAEFITKTDPGKTLENMRDNLIELRLFYEAMNFDKIEQQPQYEWPQLIGDVGGHLGFCLGASILSLYELSEFLMSLLIRTVFKLKWKTKIQVVELWSPHNNKTTGMNNEQ